VIIAALSGTAGVGKTTLAVHWAHRVSARFPDGQLYVNLEGFGPGGEALDPSEAARGFLEAFGVPATRIPADLPGRAGLYRSVLAGKRVLVVLDNARDVEQVRPLLPGSPGSLALVTSRNHLTGLVATEGAHPLALDLLPAADARDLLTRRLGSSRVALAVLVPAPAEDGGQAGQHGLPGRDRRYRPPRRPGDSRHRGKDGDYVRATARPSAQCQHRLIAFSRLSARQRRQPALSLRFWQRVLKRP